MAVLRPGPDLLRAPEELRREDEATCIGYGFHPGTDALANCLQRESLAGRYWGASPAAVLGLRVGLLVGRGPYWPWSEGADPEQQSALSRAQNTISASDQVRENATARSLRRRRCAASSTYPQLQWLPYMARSYTKPAICPSSRIEPRSHGARGPHLRRRWSYRRAQ